MKQNHTCGPVPKDNIFSWLTDWLAGWLADCGWRAGWLAVPGCLVGWGWLAGPAAIAGWLTGRGRLAGWLTVFYNWMLEKMHGQKWSILYLWEQFGAECDPSPIWGAGGWLAGWLAG